MNQRERQYKRTLEAIRASVDEIVTADGYDKLTIRGVCQKAGINHGTFYHYFKSKDDLILDRQKRFDTYFIDLYEGKLKNLPCRDALKLYTNEYIHYVQTRLINMLLSFESTLLSLSARGKLEQNSAQKILVKIIESGIASGEISADRTEENIYEFFQVLFLGVRIRFCHTSGRSLPSEETEREIYRWIDSLFL